MSERVKITIPAPDGREITVEVGTTDATPANTKRKRPDEQCVRGHNPDEKPCAPWER